MPRAPALARGQLFLCGEFSNVLCCQAHPEFDPRLMRERIEPALRSKGRLTAEELAQRARAMADCKQLASHKGRALYRGFLLRGCGRQARVVF